jgi:hypothetical protein
MSLLALIESANTKPTYSSKHYEPKKKSKDFTNKKFGSFTVIKGEHHTKEDTVKCKCDCGKIRNIRVKSLIDESFAKCSCVPKLNHKERSEKSSNKITDDMRNIKMASKWELKKMYQRYGVCVKP